MNEQHGREHVGMHTTNDPDLVGERREGHSKLVGRPLDENGGIDLRVVRTPNDFDPDQVSKRITEAIEKARADAALAFEPGAVYALAAKAIAEMVTEIVKGQSQAAKNQLWDWYVKDIGKLRKILKIDVE